MQKETIQLNICLPLIARWYAGARRDLPWRQTREPYHIWLSEIMLQQTRIEAVIPYYHRFLSRFPDIRALAQAEDEQIMKLWEGLGYYSRARYLKKAAVLIMERWGGELPRQAAELKKLPGIGDYTAGAISSIAFGEPEPAVDGNVLRVITRVLACGEDIRLAGTRSRITELLRRCYLAGEDAALLTEGIMELGETVCIPNGEARCRECPLQAHCLAHKNGIEARFPVKSPMKKRRMEEKTVLLFRREGKYGIRRRSEKGLLAGMWEFPNAEGRLSQTEAEAYGEALGLSVYACAPCAPQKHIFTHVEWQMSAYLIDCTGENGDLLWKSPEEIRKDYAVPAAFRFYLETIN